MQNDLISECPCEYKGSILFSKHFGSSFFKGLDDFIFIIGPISILRGENGISHLFGGLSDSVRSKVDELHEFYVVDFFIKQGEKQ